MISLEAESLQSLSVGSPVLFKQIEVGEITGFNLDTNKQLVQLDVFIAGKYANLVRDTSRFYNVSGVSVEA